MEGVERLPDQPTFGAIMHGSSTKAATAKHILANFGGDIEAVVQTTPDRDQNSEKFKDLLTLGLDVVLVLGGDGIVNAVGKAHMGTNSKTALAPGKTGGASDGSFLTLGNRFMYTAEGFSNQPVGRIAPMHATFTPFNPERAAVDLDAFLYFSVGGLITAVARGVNGRPHRDLLKSTTTAPLLVGQTARRASEALVILESLSEPRYIIGDKDGRVPRMVDGVTVTAGGRIAGMVPTPGDLLVSDQMHRLDTKSKICLLGTVGRIMVGRDFTDLYPYNTIEFTILTGQTPGAQYIDAMYDGETTPVPTRSLASVHRSDRSVPFVYGEERIRVAERIRRGLHLRK